MIIKPKSQVSNVRKFAPSLAKKPIIKLKENPIEETNISTEVIPKSNNNPLSLIIENNNSTNNDTSISINEKKDNINKDNIDNNEFHKSLISHSPIKNSNIKKTFISQPSSSSSSSQISVIRNTRSKTDTLANKPNSFENSVAITNNINAILQANSILESGLRNKPLSISMDNSMVEESSDSNEDIDIFNNYINKKKIVKSKQKTLKKKVLSEKKPKKEKQITKSKQKVRK
jgi:hypothetical protein